MKKEVDKKVVEQATKKAQELPLSTQFAISVALPNIANGAFWGFSTVEEVRPYADSLKEDKNITLRKINGGCIVEVNPSYICQAMACIDPSAVTEKDIKEMTEGIAKAGAVFNKFLATRSSYKGYIGVYCVNDVPIIVFKGQTYPAFRLPLVQVLQYLAEYDFNVVVDGKNIPAKSILNGNNVADVWNSMIMSPTHTGCFLAISC